MSRESPLILIDAFGIDQPGGPRTAVLFLFKKVFELRPRWRFVICLSRFEPIYQPFGHVRQIVLPVRKGIAARLFVQLTFPLLALALRADLVHFTKSQGALLLGCKKVLTIFDATTLYHPGMHSKIASWYWRHIMPAVARRHDAILAISRDAARDIQNLIGVPPDKIRVIPCASQFEGEPDGIGLPFNTVQAKYHLPERYLLFVGILSLKKNLKTLIQALAVLRDQQVDLPCLVMAGPYYPQSEDREIFKTIGNLRMEDATQYIGSVSHDELAGLYAHAEMLVLPSVHEGFGIPLLEAMGFGIPVIASNSSSMPEVVGSAGLLVDDFLSPQAWAAAIQQLLTQPGLRQELIAAGYERSRLFSWQTSAGQLARLYEALLGMRKPA